MAVPRSAAAEERLTWGSLAALLTHAGQRSVRLAVDPPILKCLAIVANDPSESGMGKCNTGANGCTAGFELVLVKDLVQTFNILWGQRNRLHFHALPFCGVCESFHLHEGM